MNEPGSRFLAIGGTETLLVAEDEELVQYALQRTLEKAGYRVIVAGNGDEAVDQFREDRSISLVLSDMVLPGKCGTEILAEIRLMNPGIKAILMSGYTPEIIQQRYPIDEGVEFISKPFRQHDLLQMIRAVLDRG